MPFAVGQQVGRYRILALLGSGGMGDVYRAHDSRLERDVAIKLLKPGSGGRDATRTLMAEARAASALSHPNACQLHEVDEVEGHAFLVMELVEGESLAAIIGSRGLSTDRVGRYAAQIASALAHAHDRGVIHRDLKTANVMVTPDGHVKVLDFGIASRLTSAGLGHTTKSVAPFDAVGIVAGTLPYMAPEVLQGSTADARSDIWALGIVLFEMIAGRRPFDGRSPFDLATAIVSAPAPDLPPGTPLGLRSVVNRCLRKAPGERYQSAGEVAAALGAISSDSWDMPARVRRTPMWTYAAALLLLAMVIAAVAWRTSTGTLGSAGIRSLAVLPFADLSPGAPTEYLAAGVTDAIITELGQLGAIRVISRTSSMRFRDSNKSMQDIAGELDVDAVLEGSLVRDGGRVRVSARLIRAATESSVWTGSYEHDLGDILALQREFAKTLARELRVTLTPDQESQLAQQQPVNPAAVEAYLQGRYQWFKRTPEALRLSIDLFEQAIRADPRYAAPHAGLANTYVLLGLPELASLPTGKSLPEAKAAAARALALDPRTADAYTALGYAELWSWNLDRSERAFRRAIELNPNDASARGWHAVRLAASGNFEESINEAKYAQQLDPVSPIVTSLLSWVCHLAGQHADAAEFARRVLVTEPDFVMAVRRLGVAYKHQGDYPRAAEQLQRAVTLSRRHADTVAQLGQVYALQGRPLEARRLLDELTIASSTSYIPAFNRALVFAGLGNRDAAFQALEQAYNERYGSLALIRVEPDLLSLRDDPRFDAFVRKIFP